MGRWRGVWYQGLKDGRARKTRLRRTDSLVEVPRRGGRLSSLTRASTFRPFPVVLGVQVSRGVSPLFPESLSRSDPRILPTHLRCSGGPVQVVSGFFRP